MQSIFAKKTEAVPFKETAPVFDNRQESRDYSFKSLFLTSLPKRVISHTKGTC